VFDPDLIPALVGTLNIALQFGTEALIALTIRNEDTFSKFLHSAGAYVAVLLRKALICVILARAITIRVRPRCALREKIVPRCVGRMSGQ
jgi:hypothetical protein